MVGLHLTHGYSHYHNSLCYIRGYEKKWNVQTTWRDIVEMSGKKVNIWFWIFWIGFIVIAYGFITFVTAIWSAEAAETAGQLGIYGSLIIGVIGIIMVVLGNLKK
jgi:hypothetical protein